MKPATLYTSLSTACLILMLFFPVSLILIGEDLYEFHLNGLYFENSLKNKWIDSYPFGWIVIALAFYNISSLFFVKKTNVRLTMGRLNYILHAVFIVVLYLSANAFNIQKSNAEVLIGYRGFYFPIASLAFLFLANRSMKEEMKLMEIIEGKGKKKAKGKRQEP